MAEDKARIVKQASSVDAQEVAAGKATRTQVLLGEADGVPNFHMRRFIMGEGGGMPRHTNSVEHEQFVLRGRAEVSIGDETFTVGPEDVLYIPAGVVHDYRVIEAPFEFLCMVPNAADTIALADD